MRRSALVLVALLSATAPAAATPDTFDSAGSRCAASLENEWLAGPSRHQAPDVWRVSWLPGAPPRPAPHHGAIVLSPAAFDETAVQARPRPVAFEYSRGYELRRRIHTWASVATLPLFAAEFAVGQSLYNGTSSSDGKRSAHAALAGGIAGLFAANSVTGVWNLWEGRKDPNGRTKRIVHGLLMLAADAGFVATGATAPEGEEGEHRYRPVDSNGRARHRTIALTSMGTALGSYLMMLLWRD